MRLFYKMEKISSEADTIKVNTYGNTVFEFHKDDFGDNWERLVNKEYELSPYEIASLDKLELTGEEEHPIGYTERDKVNWYSYARNMIRDDFLNNKERIQEIDPSKPVIITNKTPLASSSELTTLLNTAQSALNRIAGTIGSSTKIKVDLSKISFSESFNDTSFNNTAFLSSIDLAKPWNFPKSIINTKSTTNCSCYGEHLENLIDISNVDTSNIVYFDYFLKGASKITDISKLSFKNALSLNYAFMGTGIDTLPDLNDTNFPKCESFVFAFHSCNNLKQVGDINLSNNVNIYSIFFNCENLEKIGNINLPNAYSTSGANNNIYLVTNNTTEIGNIYAPNSKVYLAGKKIGNITADAFQFAQDNTEAPDEVGVINCKKNATNVSNSSQVFPPFKIKAIAASIFARNFSSTGYEHWVDIDPNPTAYRKSILFSPNGTEQEIQHIKVYKKNATFKLKLPILDVNKEYPYKFELQAVTLSTNFNKNAFYCNVYTSSDKKTKVTDFTWDSISYSDTDKAIIMEATMDNIVDDREIYITLQGAYREASKSASIGYTALIDGWPFSNSFSITSEFTYKVSVSFEVDEDISGSTRVVYDEDEVVEETQDEEIVEDMPNVEETVNENTEN